MMMLPELLTQNGFILEGFLTSCSFNYLSQNENLRIYMLILFIGGFVLPISVIIIFYSLIFYELRNNKTLAMINNLNNTYKRPEVSVDLLSHNSNLNKIKKTNTTNNKHFLHREIKAVRYSILVIVLFCLAWLPYALMTITAQLVTHNRHEFINPYTTSLPALFAKLSSICDPLVYTLSNNEYRIFLKKFLIKIFSKKK